MNAKKWAGIMSAVVVGVLVAALAIWGVNAVADRSALAETEAAQEAKNDRSDELLAAYEAQLEIDAEECDEAARAIEEGTYDEAAHEDPLLVPGKQEYGNAYDYCIELAEIDAEHLLYD